MKKIRYILTIICFILLSSNGWSSQGFIAGKCKEAACRSMTPALIGGPVAHSKILLTLRYLGAANLELTYRDQVILLSAYFGAEDRQVVVIPPEDIVRADAIFLGHQHYDHMRDAVQVSNQTGAQIYGNQTVYNTLAKDPAFVPDSQTVLVDGDVLEFDGFTVEAVRMYHSGSNAPEGPYGPTACQSTAFRLYGKAAAGEDISGTTLDCQDQIKDKGIRDVMGYLFTFGKDFRFIFWDSNSTLIAPEIYEVMESLGGSVDVASIAHAGGHSLTQVPYAMEAIKAINPLLYIPNHHTGNQWEMNLEVLFEAIRAEMPNTETLSLLFKEPLCFNVKSHVATKVSPLGSVWSYDMKNKHK